MTEWMIQGPEISNCNCNYGCPCQFNALPSEGNCRAVVGIRIDKGHHGNVRLDGLKFGAVVAWPGPIHEGKGEVLPIIDERATPEQREALLKIMTGQDTEPGATIFQVFATTYEKAHDPVFTKIDFAADLDSCEGSLRVAGVFEASTTAIRNPITGDAHHAKVSLRNGFEYAEAEFASGTAKSAGPIKIDHAGTHAHLAMIHMTGHGIVH